MSYRVGPICNVSVPSYKPMYTGIEVLVYFVLLAGFEQFPKGPMLQIDGSKTKVTYRVSTNETKIQSLKLEATLGESRIQNNGRHDNVTVIYNDCTDSDTPDWLCKECQITFRGTQNFKNISLDLYKKTNLTVVKVYNLAQNRIVQIERPTIPLGKYSTVCLYPSSYGFRLLAMAMTFSLCPN